MIYNWHEILAWVEINPLDKILWTQSEKVEKPIIGLDTKQALAFITGHYDPVERQIDNMRRRIAARSVVRRRHVVSIGKAEPMGRPKRGGSAQ